MLADYNFYLNIYGGENIPNLPQFNRYCFKASKFLSKITFGRIDSIDVSEDIQYAVCYIVDELYNNEKVGNKTTETVGNHTVSYVKLEGKEFDKKLYNIAKTFLSEELLYRGVY